jgi:hypothetical protein
MSMSLASFNRFRRALDGGAAIAFTALGLLLSASMLFVGA